MEKETMGTVISVTKQWWLKVNRKPARVHAMDGAAFSAYYQGQIYDRRQRLHLPKMDWRRKQSP